MSNQLGNKQLVDLWQYLSQAIRKYPYKKLFSVSVFSIFSLSATLSLPSASIANPQNAQLQEWRFSPEIPQLEFTLSAASQPKLLYLRQPERLVIDIPSTKLGFVSTRQDYNGAIQRVRLSQLNASVTRIVMDLAPGSTFNPNQVSLQSVSSNRWVLRPFLTSYNPNTIPGGYFPNQPNNYPPGTYAPQPQNNLPPGMYAPPSVGNLPNNLPNIPPELYPSQPNGNLPPTLGGNNNLPPLTNNINNNTQQQPFVSVPPLNSNNTPQIPGSTLPPAIFSNPSGGFNNAPPLMNPNSVITYPNDVNGGINSNLTPLPWGQNLLPNPGQ
ncbi:AMIN domain-containing protein [Brunnivagina elsteri]|uniref:AMIN domain-containing protein n=1 Tax=Brunnivagina elsteri CCALA 953 TaxID=987040 RepID=A0A2A2TJG8_9CYAN|nr:AMIN domain-containing protein [Calothrix elsteri]PAX55144.1 AMIN domain-containing protein [Calothrix elsteri CCALA 953]